MIKRPQKAPSDTLTNEQLSQIRFPLLGSPKLDGFRCVTANGAFTSSLKPVTNRFVQKVLSDLRYSGLDGELIVGPPNHPDVFNNTTGPVRRFDGEPDFTFYVFDIHSLKSDPYQRRLEVLNSLPELPRVKIIKQRVLQSAEDIIDFETTCVARGYEGAMVRSPHGLYKEGRCTFKEANIFKRKPVRDDEALIIGFEEQLQNNNESRLNEMGNMVRSSHKANKTGKGTLGKFIVRSPTWPEVFAIGTGKGLTDDLRQRIWDNQDVFMGQVIVYKYQEYGSINAPRQPIFKGFRDPKDITKW